MSEEATFYSELGMNDAFAVCAVGDVLESLPDYKNQKGWGFAIADIERFGLVNTIYLGDGVYEKDSARFKQYLILLTADECLSLIKF